MSQTPGPALRRDIGTLGAVMMGLGSIIGTGVFVSLGVAVGVAGPAVVLAIALAACLAACNALSSAQLAASHPRSGGTYEFGYLYLTPTLGFAAGWMFLCAKAASAATAALGLAGYTLVLLGAPGSPWRIPLALAAVAAITTLVLTGIRRTSRVNAAIVAITLVTLLGFVLAGLPNLSNHAAEHFDAFFDAPAGDARAPLPRLLEAVALMFVAYAGYARITTLSEEVRRPERTIPRAIILTLVIAMALYIAVAVVGVGAAGATAFAGAGDQVAAPLAVLAEGFGVPGIPLLLAIGAITAMLGVGLNLVLGLSRVLLAMARRGDAPAIFARIGTKHAVPWPAVLLVGAAIMGLASLGDLKLAWSFSAFTVLMYYAITNAAALRLPKERRLYHPAIAWCGLGGCIGLAFWVQPSAWIGGLAVLGAGLAGRWLFRRVRARRAAKTPAPEATGADSGARD